MVYKVLLKSYSKLLRDKVSLHYSCFFIPQAIAHRLGNHR